MNPFAPAPVKPEVETEVLEKLDVRVGTILRVEPVERSDKLVVLEVEADDLPDLKWEPARGGDLFPHLYRPLDTSLVRAVRAAPLGEDGAPRVEVEA